MTTRRPLQDGVQVQISDFAKRWGGIVLKCKARLVEIVSGWLRSRRRCQAVRNTILPTKDFTANRSGVHESAAGGCRVFQKKLRLTRSIYGFRGNSNPFTKQLGSEIEGLSRNVVRKDAEGKTKVKYVRFGCF